MAGVFQFIKSTIIGGLLVLVPLVILIVIIVQAVGFIRNLIEPLVRMLPDHTIGGVSLAMVLASVILVLACFLVGLVAELALAKRLIRSVEYIILARIPGYSLMKNVGENLAGVEGDEGRKTVLLRTEGVAQLGFMMETLPDGNLVVFVPDVPSALSGRVFVVPPDRIETLPMKIGTTIDCLSRLGIGLKKELRLR